MPERRSFKKMFKLEPEKISQGGMPFSAEFLFPFVPFNEEFYVHCLVYQIGPGGDGPAYLVAGFIFAVKIPDILHA